MGIRNSKPMPFEPIHEGRHDSRSYKLPDHLAIFHTTLVEFENSLCGNGRAFHARHLGELDHFSAAIA